MNHYPSGASLTIARRLSPVASTLPAKAGLWLIALGLLAVQSSIKRLLGLSLILLISFSYVVSANGAPITGPNGGIVGASSTVAPSSFGINGGCVGAAASTCSINGQIGGVNLTYIDYVELAPHTFSYTLNGPHNVTAFRLWNDTGLPTISLAGIRDFRLDFVDVNNSTTSFSATTAPPAGTVATPEVFNVGLRSQIVSVDLVVNTLWHSSGYNEFREIEFEGAAVPEPSTAVLLGCALIAFMRPRGFLH